MQFSTEQILAEFSEIGVLALTFCLGWFAWAFVLRITKQHFQVWEKSTPAAGTAASKLVDSWSECEKECDEEEASEAPSVAKPEGASKQDMQKLFESYNLFGASAGAWSGEFDVCDSDSELSEDETSSPGEPPVCQKHHEERRDSEVSTAAGSDVDASEEEAEPLRYSIGFQEASRPSPAALFEHYNLFGAPTGTWSR
jgi:hypothetical protein